MKKKKKRLMGALSMLLIMAMVLTSIPYWPVGLLQVNAADSVVWIDGSTVSTPTKGSYYYYDFTAQDNGAGTASKYATAGTYGTMTTATGPNNGIGYQGSYYGLAAKQGNSFTIQVPGNSYIVVGGDNNSGSAATITATSSTGGIQEATKATKTAGHCSLTDCENQTANSVPFLYVGSAGSVTLTLDGSTAYIAAICVIPAADDATLTQYEQKSFSLDINGVSTSVTTGATASDNSSVTVGTGGSLELATVDKAIVWADLDGKGSGTLTSEMLTNLSSNITATVSGKNTIAVTYKDTTKDPTAYTIYVKDNSALGTAIANGTPVTYDFRDGSVLSSLHTGSYKLTGGATVQSIDKQITLTGNNSIFWNDASHGIAINNTDTISVKVAGDAIIDIANCAYSGGTVTATITTNDVSGTGTITPSVAQSAKAATDGDITEYSYTGSPATITFTYAGGSSYIHSMTVTNAAPKSTEKTQTKMPSIMTYGTASALAVSPVGQRLTMKQLGGSLTTVSGAINSNISYYAFDSTTDANKLTADVVLNVCGASNSYGVFFGAFDGTYAATVGIRNSTGLRGIYSKSATDMVGAGGINSTLPAGTVVSFTAQKTDAGFVVTATPKGGATQTMSFSYNSPSYLLFSKNGKDTPVSYGFIVSSATATVTNMKYYDANGAVLYDQNDCYTAAGTAPVVSTVKATAASTRDSITLNWTSSTEADGDGRYVIQVSKDGSTWADVATDITDKTYTYPISDAGKYKFRVCGMLGTNGVRNAYTESPEVDVIAALTTPSVNIASSASAVTLDWQSVDKATKYEVYRYSYDETAANAKKIAEVTSTDYTDTNVVAEMPYYYYVIAYSADNYSNPSSAVWAVPSAGHSGQYQYEDTDAGITITKKSYDTVYTNKITLEGIVESAGNVVLQVNGKAVTQTAVTARGTFAFDDITINAGRNDVNLLVTDSTGKITRKTFNFVYLTNYQKVVDAAFTGNDGDNNADGLPTYKTVQAAVNSVAASNTDRIVILVKEGSYNEHLQVTSPNITLIGEDSTKTRIHYYDETQSPVGGDMAKRCAIYIQSTATGFSAENLTFCNDYQYQGTSGAGNAGNESADALRSDANNASYVNIRIEGYQDTLCANVGTQYYYKCYITGNVDFIYGNDPRAFFNDCQLVFRYSAAKNSGYVCAPKTATAATYGLTFNNCQILSENGCSGSKYYLARPWGQDGYATWINCYMGKILKANTVNPYSDMSGALASAARFYEFGSYGPGYAINTNRRQISSTMASKMATATYLTWDTYTAVATIGTKYTGTVNTTAASRYITSTYTPTTYSIAEGDDTGLAKYGIEGYAQNANVTGGGTLYETSSDYYKVSTAEEFLKALVSVKSSGNKSVIELTADIALGCNEVPNFSSYSAVIKADAHQPLTNPILLKTGVSSLTLDGMSNLTIYSKNGAKITHTTTDITNSSNLIIRNINYDELWEWDEATSGNYDLNDWDYMTIEKGSQDIWVDHCTFHKAYDGVIDIKTPTSANDITISWCKFLPGSENNTFFNAMMNELKNNASKYTYYSTLLSEGMTADQIYSYAYGQKKTHLLGQDDNDSSASNICVTLANNYYKDSMDRMPRLRYGTAHVYNCIMDAQDLRTARAAITNPTLAEKIVSNGASSTCGGHILLENCYISGISNALNSGNGSSPHGYINAINSSYFLDGVAQTLTVTNNNTLNDGALVQDPTAFKTALPYSNYTLYSADKLSTEVQPFTGAGALNMTTLQWEKTTYSAENHVWDAGVVTKEPTCTTPGVKTYTCLLCGETKTEEIPALGHKYSTEWTIDKQPTTTEEGSKSHHCTVCGDKTDITVIPKINASSANISTSVQNGENTPQTTLGTSTTDLINNELTADEAAAVAGGADLKFYLSVEDGQSTISSTDKALIESVLGQKVAGATVGQYLDISLLKKIGTASPVKITDTKVGIKITIKIPDSLKKAGSTGTRTYRIVRVHNGVATVIDGIYNEADGTFTFITDEFSTYALVYSDTLPSNGGSTGTGTTGTTETTGAEGTDTTSTVANTQDNTSVKSENANAAATGDNTSMAWLFVLLLLSGSTVVVTVRRKKRKTAGNE